MRLKEFAVERYFAKYEFTAKYMLSSSDCDGFSLNEVLKLANPKEKDLWDNLHLGYTETLGAPFLREAIAQKYETILSDEILVASPGELNFILMNVLLEKDDHVICIGPAYQSLYQVAMDLGCEVSFWNPKIENDKWVFDIEDLKQLKKSNTKLLITNFPHNPTGFFPSQLIFDEIIKFVKDSDLYLFSDEMYKGLHYGKYNDLPSACDVYDKAISLWGTAKTFGLAGLRLGWICTKDKKILQEVSNFKDYLSICNSATSEILGTIALNNMEYFTKINIQKIERNLDFFQDFITEFSPLFTYVKPDAGSTAFVKIHIPENTLDFSKKLVEETGVMILPGETFDTHDNFFRVGFGRENFPKVLKVFGEFLKKYHGN